MPIAKYKKDKKSNLYYSYVKTGLFTSKGKPEYKKIRAKTIDALDKKVDEYNSTSAFGIVKSSITVDAWKEQWFTGYKSGLRESTQVWYNSLYNAHVQRAIGKARVSDVREVALQRILSNMADKKYSHKTISAVRMLLYSLFGSARDNRMIAVNPAEHLKAKGEKSKSRRALTESERLQYLNACKNNEFGLFGLFAYFFGMRRGEILALSGGDISDDGITVSKQYCFPSSNAPKLSDPKTTAGKRTIPIPDKSKEYINYAQLQKVSGLLICDDDGNPLTYTVVRKKWNNFIKAALGADTDITIHSVRHNYCTMLFEQGVDLLTAKEVMGHEDIQTTLSIYTHYNDAIKERTVDSVKKVGK